MITYIVNRKAYVKFCGFLLLILLPIMAILWFIPVWFVLGPLVRLLYIMVFFFFLIMYIVNLLSVANVCIRKEENIPLGTYDIEKNWKPDLTITLRIFISGIVLIFLSALGWLLMTTTMIGHIIPYWVEFFAIGIPCLIYVIGCIIMSIGLFTGSIISLFRIRQWWLKRNPQYIISKKNE